MESLDDDDEYRKQQEARAAEIEAQDAQQAQQKQNQAVDAAGKANPPGVMQEIGTAAVGAGIDAVEGVGATAEAALTLQMNNPNFKPTWLQVADEKEPMNRTVWGKLLRGIGEYAILTGVLKRAAGGAKAIRVPGANALSQALSRDAAKTVTGRVVRDATKGAIIGAAADFTSSYAEGETLSTELNKMFPQFTPNWLVTTKDDTPLQRRVKNVIEGLGLGAVTDIAFGWRAAQKAAKATSEQLPEDTIKAFRKVESTLTQTQDKLFQKAVKINPEGKLSADELSYLRETDPEYVALEAAQKTLKKEYKQLHDTLDPKAVGESYIADNAARRDANFDEKVRTALDDDPEGLEPNAWVNSPMYDPPDQALFTPAGSKGLYQSLVDSYKMETDGVMKNGRRPSVYTEAALEKRLSQFNPERRKAIEAVAKQLEKELADAPERFKIEGFKKEVTVEQLKALSTAKYIDIISDITDDPDNLEKLRTLLMDQSQTRRDLLSGEEIPYLNPVNHRAAEMLIHTTAGELSDLAQAGRSIHGVMSNERQVEGLLNRMKFLLMETGKGKYFKGYDLMALAKDPAARRAAEGGLQKVEKDVDDFVNNLKNLFDNDPEMLKHWLDVMALADGKVQALDEMYKFAKDQVFNWQSLIGHEGKRSAFMDSITSIMYNSVLSGPKTIMRAFMGTGTTTFLRPVQAILGGVVSGNPKAAAMGLQTLRASFESIGETMDVFRMAWNAGKNNLEDIPYLSQTRMPMTMTDQWKNVGAVIERQGTMQEKMMYRLTTTLYDFNNWIGVKYPLTTMSAIDAGTRVVMGRMDAKLQAFSKAWDETGGRNMDELITKYEKEFIDQVFDHKNQMVKSEYAIRMADEAGLRLPLSGGPLDAMAAKTENFVSQVPMLRSMFMFMQTGWNALQLVQKHTPILARFNTEVNTILKATPDQLDEVMPYGITNAAQLLEAQAVARGRIATGYLTVASAIGLYYTGGLTGNGPADREARNAWIQSGWRPRSIRLGNQWVSYDSLEPFTSFLAMTADIGDNANLLGETATQGWYKKIAYLIGMNVSNKSFLAGLGPLTEVLALDPSRSAVWAANIANNQIPWAGVRNELANAFNPGMRELDKDWTKSIQAIMNRNPGLKDDLPLKYDVLDGSVVRMYDPMIRAINIISPLQINFTDNATRRTLRDSGYDVVTTLSTDSNGNKLDAKTRSRMQNLMGQQNIEKQLERLFAEPAIKKEMETYRKLRDLGVRNTKEGEGGDARYGMDVEDSKFYKRINLLFRNAKKKAEAQLQQEYPDLRHRAVERRAVEALQKSNKPDAAAQRILEYKNK